jgi:hypothetical protein
MKIVWNRKKMVLALVLFLSFVTVFFIKWDFDKEDLERELTFA